MWVLSINDSNWEARFSLKYKRHNWEMYLNKYASLVHFVFIIRDMYVKIGNYQIKSTLG